VKLQDCTLSWWIISTFPRLADSSCQGMDVWGGARRSGWIAQG